MKKKCKHFTSNSMLHLLYLVLYIIFDTNLKKTCNTYLQNIYLQF